MFFAPLTNLTDLLEQNSNWYLLGPCLCYSAFCSTNVLSPLLWLPTRASCVARDVAISVATVLAVLSLSFSGDGAAPVPHRSNCFQLTVLYKRCTGSIIFVWQCNTVMAVFIWQYRSSAAREGFLFSYCPHSTTVTIAALFMGSQSQITFNDVFLLSKVFLKNLVLNLTIFVVFIKDIFQDRI